MFTTSQASKHQKPSLSPKKKVTTHEQVVVDADFVYGSSGVEWLKIYQYIFDFLYEPPALGSGNTALIYQLCFKVDWEAFRHSGPSVEHLACLRLLAISQHSRNQTCAACWFSSSYMTDMVPSMYKSASSHQNSKINENLDTSTSNKTCLPGLVVCSPPSFSVLQPSKDKSFKHNRFQDTFSPRSFGLKKNPPDVKPIQHRDILGPALAAQPRASRSLPPDAFSWSRGAEEVRTAIFGSFGSFGCWDPIERTQHKPP